MRGLYWFQGEADAGFSQGLSDAAADARVAAYQARLVALLGFIRADYGSTLPIVLFQIDWTTATGNDATRRDQIRAIQQAVADADAYTSIVDTRGLDRNVDGVHLTQQGRHDAAVLALAAMKALL